MYAKSLTHLNKDSNNIIPTKPMGYSRLVDPTKKQRKQMVNFTYMNAWIFVHNEHDILGCKSWIIELISKVRNLCFIFHFRITTRSSTLIVYSCKMYVYYTLYTHILSSLNTCTSTSVNCSTKHPSRVYNK